MPDSAPTSFSPSSSGIERTEVIKNPEDMVRVTTEDFSKIKNRMDICCDFDGIRVTFEVKPIWNAYCALKGRGIRLRWITEVTKENIYFCKELAKIAELRHLDGIKSAFGIHDGLEYRASARVNSLGQLPRELIKTNVKEIVEQQQYVYDILWARAIPFRQRIREIEEGAKRDFIDTIQDFDEVQNVLNTALNSVTDEVMIIFPSVNIFYKYVHEGLLGKISELVSSRQVTVRILLPDTEGTIEINRMVPNHGIQKEIDVLCYSKSIDNRLTIFVLDNEFSLTIEVRDESKNSLFEFTGLATFSNSESTVLSYISIFENLWMDNSKP